LGLQQKDRRREIRGAQVGRPEVRAGHVGQTKAGATQIGTDQVGTPQVRTPQIAATKRRPDQIGPAVIRAPAGGAGADEIAHPREQPIRPVANGVDVQCGQLVRGSAAEPPDVADRDPDVVVQRPLGAQGFGLAQVPEQFVHARITGKAANICAAVVGDSRQSRPPKVTCATCWPAPKQS